MHKMLAPLHGPISIGATLSSTIATTTAHMLCKNIWWCMCMHTYILLNEHYAFIQLSQSGHQALLALSGH